MNDELKFVDELYSRLSLADKLIKINMLTKEWRRLVSAYSYLVQVYNIRGFLLSDEAKAANQLSQMMQEIQYQKMQVNNEICEEMKMRLIKMLMYK